MSAAAGPHLSPWASPPPCLPPLHPCFHPSSLPSSIPLGRSRGEGSGPGRGMAGGPWAGRQACTASCNTGPGPLSWARRPAGSGAAGSWPPLVPGQGTSPHPLLGPLGQLLSVSTPSSSVFLTLAPSVSLLQPLLFTPPPLLGCPVVPHLLTHLSLPVSLICGWHHHPTHQAHEPQAQMSSKGPSPPQICPATGPTQASKLACLGSAHSLHAGVPTSPLPVAPLLGLQERVPAPPSG